MPTVYTGSNYCPIPAPKAAPDNYLFDRHGPAIVPLPDGEFKMYVEKATDQYYVVYWNGTSWMNEAPVQLLFDGGSSITHACLGNPDAFVYATPGAGYEGMFFQAVPGSSCFNNGGSPPSGVGGIVYAEHTN